MFDDLFPVTSKETAKEEVEQSCFDFTEVIDFDPFDGDPLFDSYDYYQNIMTFFSKYFAELLDEMIIQEFIAAKEDYRQLSFFEKNCYGSFDLASS